MTIEIINDQVYAVKEFENGASMKKLIGAVKKAEASFSNGETVIKKMVGETEELTFRWKIFDLERGEYVPDAENTADFEVMITELGSPKEVISSQTVPFGETLMLTLNRIGSFKINVYGNGFGNEDLRLEVE